MFGRSKRGPAGYVQIFHPAERAVERETMQCVHCGAHWITAPGSGRRRGFCTRCNGLTCGAEACNPCVPYEARLEIEEGAHTPLARAYLEDYRRVMDLKG